MVWLNFCRHVYNKMFVARCQFTRIFHFNVNFESIWYSRIWRVTFWGIFSFHKLYAWYELKYRKCTSEVYPRSYSSPYYNIHWVESPILIKQNAPKFSYPFKTLLIMNVRTKFFFYKWPTGNCNTHWDL